MHRIEDLNRNRTYAGRFLLRFKTLESTNAFCLENEFALLKAGLAVMTDSQTRGRGSKGRTWQSGIGGNLFCSLVVHPDFDVNLIPSMTIFAGLSVFRTLETLGAKNLSIKWPNDILINNRKVSGILCESRITPGFKAVVAGIGINISGTALQFSEDLRNKAATLSEHGIQASRLKLVDSISEELDRILLAAGRPRGHEEIFRKWEKASSSIGSQVTFSQGTDWETGIIEGLDNQGRLMVRKGDSTVVPILSGTVEYSRDRTRPGSAIDSENIVV